jgi:hypothetical protein
VTVRDVLRYTLLLLLVVLCGCADQSKGAALNECRTKNYLLDPAAQSQLTPDCMKEKSFQFVANCAPTPDESDWDPNVAAFHFNDPRCYEAVGAAPWLATLLSPM